MEALREVYQLLGYDNVRTYVQSGNVIFESEERDQLTLAGKIESEIERAFGYSVPVIVRDTDYFQWIIGSNPYVNRDPARLYVTFLYHTPPGPALQNLPNPGLDGDEFVAGQQEIYLFCPGGYGRSKLSNTFFEKKLGVLATTRNWNTVNALYTIASQR
jgi:uncharacterized protein (DUF1697 family)